MADLEKFSDDLQGGNDPNSPPSVISAGKLDRNFARCSPVPQDGDAAPYKVDKTDDGWKIMPQIEFYVCVDGSAVKYKFLAERA